MSARLRQADKRWSSLALGLGPSTIGRAGCLLCCLCEATKILRGTDMLPPHLNQAGRIASAFIGSGAKTSELGRAAGLDVRQRVDGGNLVLLATIRTTINSRGCCLLHVDKSGDGAGDHWILAHAIDGDSIICSDSAVGMDVSIPCDTLSASVMWGKEQKTYGVRGVRPVYPLN